ncbi:MAG: ferric iron uptake transcriptional regulator [Gammaproteobacteria bacterium]|nr:ferric iron uptake transcriptional regulator [Gammaproteobacteria bacterium]
MGNQDRELREAGLKVTVPRMRILQILETSALPHMSAEDVYRALGKAGEDVGFATVYRVLTQFEQAELVVRHNFEGGHAVFEMAGGRHHDHFVCVKCGHIEEFSDDVIEERQQLIAARLGYTITDHRLTLYGTCSGDCEHLRALAGRGGGRPPR